GQTIGDASAAVEQLFMNFEHSYMGDLIISFICPNGQSIQVHDQGGTNTFLGEPVDNDADPDTPGIGYDYSWAPDATNGTWSDNAGLGTLPAGAYESVQTFANLDGCPLNGVW
ncbi:MAG: proprotein convertase P-domain-containing protein, partial [Flavobacteriales bacterium]